MIKKRNKLGYRDFRIPLSEEARWLFHFYNHPHNKWILLALTEKRIAHNGLHNYYTKACIRAIKKLGREERKCNK